MCWWIFFNVMVKFCVNFVKNFVEYGLLMVCVCIWVEGLKFCKFVLRKLSFGWGYGGKG